MKNMIVTVKKDAHMKMRVKILVVNMLYTGTRLNC